MHRGHASFGHIAHFGGMGLQQFYNLGIAGGLDDGHAGVGDFALGFNFFMDVKKRIESGGLADHLWVVALRQSGHHHGHMRDNRLPHFRGVGGGKG